MTEAFIFLDCEMRLTVPTSEDYCKDQTMNEKCVTALNNHELNDHYYTSSVVQMSFSLLCTLLQIFQTFLFYQPKAGSLLTTLRPPPRQGIHTARCLPSIHFSFTVHQPCG